jgi:hypothetical protein
MESPVPSARASRGRSICRIARIAGAQTKRRFDAREAVLGVAEKQLEKTGERMGVGVVGVQRDRSFCLRDRRSPLPLREVEKGFCPMKRGILRLKRQGRVDCFLGARNVACGVVAP